MWRPRCGQGGPGGPPCPSVASETLLPGAALAAAGGAGAGAADDAGRVASDVERVAGLRGSLDRVRARRRRLDSHRAGGGRRGTVGQVQTGDAERAGGVGLATRVVLGVGEARLNVRDQVASIRLGGRVLVSLLLTPDGRHGDTRRK